MYTCILKVLPRIMPIDIYSVFYFISNAMKNSNINCTVSNVMFAISVPLDP